MSVIVIQNDNNHIFTTADSETSCIPPLLFQQSNHLHTHHFAGYRVVKDVVDPPHLNQHSPKGQEVTHCVQPGMKLERQEQFITDKHSNYFQNMTL